MYTGFQLKHVDFTRTMQNLKHILEDTINSTNNCGSALICSGKKKALLGAVP
jgi:hypothetical protein